MLKILFQLWWKQTIRLFDWKKMGILLYILLCAIGGFVIGFSQSETSLDQLFADIDPYKLIVPISFGIFLPDLIMKLVMKFDQAGMDDYLRSKPIAQKTWQRFLLCVNLIGIWNLVTPVLITACALIILPTKVSILIFIATYIMSTTNGMFVTGIRKAQDWAYKLSLWTGLLLYLVISSLILLFWFNALSGIVSMLVWMGLTLMFNIAIYIHMTHFKHYNEEKTNTQRATKLQSKSLFSLEYIAPLRAKRLRKSIIFIFCIMLFNAYTQTSNPSSPIPTLELESITMLLVPVILSLIFGQSIFCIEGNFFQGLMTKPIAVKGMLQRKIIFFIMLNIFGSLTLLPGVWLKGWNIFTLLAIMIYACGLNVLMIPTCLFSRRLDLFSSAYFNYQGANWYLSLYTFVILIPFGVLAWVLYIVPNPLLSHIIIIALGLLGLALTPLCINLTARKFYQKRHQRMETFNL